MSENSPQDNLADLDDAKSYIFRGPGCGETTGKCYYLFDCRQLQGKVKLLINMFEHFTKFSARESEWEQHKLRPISGD